MLRRFFLALSSTSTISKKVKVLLHWTDLLSEKQVGWGMVHTAGVHVFPHVQEKPWELWGEVKSLNTYGKCIYGWVFRYINHKDLWFLTLSTDWVLRWAISFFLIWFASSQLTCSFLGPISFQASVPHTTLTWGLWASQVLRDHTRLSSNSSVNPHWLKEQCRAIV